MSTAPTTTAATDDTTKPVAAAPPPKVMKAVGFTKWRADANVTIAAETLNEVDKLLLTLNWSSLVNFTFPDVLGDFPVNMTFVTGYARDTFEIKPMAIRTRVANTIAYIASRIFFTAAAIVKQQGRNRIMPGHVAAAWTFIDAFIKDFQWVAPAAAPAEAPAVESGGGEVAAAAVDVVVTKKKTAATAAKKRPAVDDIVAGGATTKKKAPAATAKKSKKAAAATTAAVTTEVVAVPTST